MPRTLRRRRKEARTDYRLRLGLLKSGKPRLVVRKTNKYILAQIVKSEGAQDKVILGVSSKSLLSKGWPKSKSVKNLSAAYLTGLLIGKLSKEKELILDIGMNRNIPKSKLYAFLKGALDAGLNIPHSEEALPSLDRLKSDVLEKVKKEIQNG